MVFETSCWVSSSTGLNNGYNNCTNPIQRRTKINFFDTSTVNATSTISHISSNGYYGYCPTTMHVNNNQIQAANMHTNHADDIDTDMSIDDNKIVSNEVHQSIQGQCPTIEKRKRLFDNDMTIDRDAKRCRNERKTDACDGMSIESIRYKFTNRQAQMCVCARVRQFVNVFLFIFIEAVFDLTQFFDLIDQLHTY